MCLYGLPRAGEAGLRERVLGRRGFLVVLERVRLRGGVRLSCGGTDGNLAPYGDEASGSSPGHRELDQEPKMTKNSKTTETGVPGPAKPALEREVLYLVLVECLG